MNYNLIKLLSLSCVTALFLSGCALSDSNSQTSHKSVTYTSNGSGDDSGYLYNRTNNLEYMDVKSVEKLKKAVAILIDKVDEMERNAHIKQEVSSEVDKKTTQINSELNAIKKDIGTLKKSPTSTQTNNNKAGDEFTDDDMKIMQFIENGKRE